MIQSVKLPVRKILENHIASLRIGDTNHATKGLREMNEDGEVFLAMAGVMGIAAAAHHFKSWCQTGVKRSWKSRLPVVLVIPFSMLFIVLPVLFKEADSEVRNSSYYLFILMTDGVAWLLFIALNLVWLGVDIQQDVIEQRNDIASWVITSAVIAAALVYAGANTGTGPSLWNNVFCVLLGTAGFAVSWLYLEISTKASLAITEDRDLTSAIRLSGFLLANGAVCARAIAGDWHSVAGTIQDFLKDGAWLLVLLVAAICGEMFCQPTVKRPFPEKITFGVFPALFYLSLAGGWIWHLGWWEGAK